MPAGKLTMYYNGKKSKRKVRSRNKNKSIKKDVKMLKKALEAEKGILDTQLNIGCSASWNNVLNCFQTAQGDNFDNREGLNIIARTISVKGYIERIDTSNRVRLVFVMFESADDNSIANVMQFSGSALQHLNQALYSPYKVDGDCKYTILADKEYVCDENHKFAKVDFSVRIPTKKNIMKYTATGSAIPRTNQISLLVVSDSQVIDHPMLQCNVRQRFTK